jgi:hypothetical protein
VGSRLSFAKTPVNVPHLTARGCLYCLAVEAIVLPWVLELSASARVYMLSSDHHVVYGAHSCLAPACLACLLLGSCLPGVSPMLTTSLSDQKRFVNIAKNLSKDAETASRQVAGFLMSNHTPESNGPPLAHAASSLARAVAIGDSVKTRLRVPCRLQNIQ